MAELTIIAENRVSAGMGIIGEHGFAALLKTGDSTVLFDTGQGMCLPQNAPRLGVDFSAVDLIALSHGHYDHTGGLEFALQSGGGKKVVCHEACFEKKMVERDFAGKTIQVYIGTPQPREELEQAGADFVFVEDHQEIAPGVYFFTSIPMKTGFENIGAGFFIDDGGEKRPDDFKDDACIAVETEKGLSVILGCAHRGAVNTLTHVMDELGVDSLYSVWGGTHMIDRSEMEIEATVSVLRGYGIEVIGVSHCTGLSGERSLEDAFGDKFARVFAGSRFEI